jgi:peptidoglycan/LPS O-acetylase OafA/YrhL
MATDLAEDAPLGRSATSGPFAPKYLRFLDVFRVVACAAVVCQHSFIWTGMSHNSVGTGFITMLHFTRNAFFFLSGLVIAYAQISRPRSLWGFWSRRYVQIGVPYLVWTAIYFVFTLLRATSTVHDAGHLLVTDLAVGYYQLYVVVVLLQAYLVFPLLMKLLRSTRRHGLILGLSMAFALFLGIILHYSLHLGPVTSAMRWLDHWWPWSRDLLSYQEFFVAGALAAFHLDEILAFFAVHFRRIGMLTAALGVVTLFWYMITIWGGGSLADGSDVYTPIAVVWSLAAVAGLLSLSWWWVNREPVSSKRRRLPSAAYLAELTGGIYLCHVLYINMIRAALESLGLFATLPWPITVAILYVGTLTFAVPFTALVQRTPVRWIIGGPVRSQQRAEYARGHVDPAFGSSRD